MSHAQTEQPAPQIGEDTKIKVDLKTVVLVVAAVIAVALGYSNFREEVNALKRTTQNHEVQLSNIQTTVNKLDSQSNAQTEILKYLARDRRGPVPDAAK